MSYYITIFLCMYFITHYSLRPILTEPLIHFTFIKKKCISERERKMVFSALINYLCILLYHKCKLEYIELGVVKVLLISVIIGKN